MDSAVSLRENLCSEMYLSGANNAYLLVRLFSYIYDSLRLYQRV